MMRKLLVMLLFIVAFLAVVPSAQAQSAEIWVYAGVTADTSLVYAYAESDLWYPSCSCTGWDYDSCWLDYTLQIQAALNHGGNTVESYSWEEYCSGVWVTVSVTDPDPGDWDWVVNVYSPVNWRWVYYECYYYELSSYLYGGGTYSAYVSGGDPQISISSDQYVDDSETPNAYFNVSSQGGTPTSHAWSFTVGSPPSPGNSPSVNFTDPYDSDTFTNSHWYAYPDDACSASRISPYTVTATVTFGNIQRTASAGLAAQVPWTIGGTTTSPTIAGNWTGSKAGSVWYVYSTNFSRTQPQVNIIVPSTSQFWSKVNVHEQVHVDQYGPGGMFANRWNPDDLRSAIINLTDSTEQGLINKVNQAYEAYMGLQDLLWEAGWLNSELEAHYVSDPVNPQYLYQVCP